MVVVPDPQAALILLRTLQDRLGDRVTSFELIGQSCFTLLEKHFPELRQPFSPVPQWAALIELTDCGEPAVLNDRLLEMLAESAIEDAVLARSATEIEALWRLREEIPEAQKREGVSIKHDISVPVSRVPDFLAACAPRITAAFADASIVAFGHLGDGNLHYNVFRTDKSAGAYRDEVAINTIVYDCVAEFAGSFSAEHGIGQLKPDALAHYRGGVELAMMQAIKQTLDPQGRMNPGKLFR